MIVGIQGSKNFSDYTIFLRAMGTALSMLPEDDEEFLIYSCGPAQINSFGMEFSNITERSMKARGKKIRLIKVPPVWFKQNINSVNYFIYFSKPKETVSDIVDLAESKDIEVGIYRY